MLPKGGIKGLMYYKSAIAQKNKIDLEVDISLETHSILEKLPEKDIKTLCRLIGIYFDNAIEAARETRKKKVLVEVYEIKDHVTFVFSNTFKKAKNFDDRNKKGVSSKGKGHGNGLYFASKLIKENPSYGKMVCKCEFVTEGEIIDSIKRPLGATTLDGVKRRTRASMGGCQGIGCMIPISAILSRELGIDISEVNKDVKNSSVVGFKED